MEEISRKNLEQAMNDCLARADVCPSDSDDYYKLMDLHRQYGDILVKLEQLENEKKIEDRKYKDSRSWFNPRTLLELTVPILGNVVLFLLYRSMIREQTINLCQFERDNTFTTYAGKELKDTVRLPKLGIKGIM